MKYNLIDVGSGGDMPKAWNKNNVNHLMTFDPRDIDGNISDVEDRYSGERFHFNCAVFDVEVEFQTNKREEFDPERYDSSGGYEILTDDTVEETDD